MLCRIYISPSLQDALWAGLDPDVIEWLNDNNIWYDLLDCDDKGRMFLTLREEDAVAFKLRWA